jgi:hypothetical protein
MDFLQTIDVFLTISDFLDYLGFILPFPAINSLPLLWGE